MNQKLPVWWILILAPMGYLLNTLFFYLPDQLILTIINFTGIQQFRIFSIIIYNLCTGIAVLVYYFLLRSKGLSFHRAGYRNKLTVKGIFFALGAFVFNSLFLYQIISILLYYVNIPMFWEQVGETPIKQNITQDIILGFLSSAIFAPLTEDTIFRGYVFQMLAERIKISFAMILSSLVFSLIHITFFGPGLTIWVFFFGLTSAYLYHKFDSIYPSLIFHFLNNLWGYVIVPLIFK